MEINGPLVAAFGRLGEWFGTSGEVRCCRSVSDKWTISEAPDYIALTNYYLLILTGKGVAKSRKNLNGLDLCVKLVSY